MATSTLLLIYFIGMIFYIGAAFLYYKFNADTERKHILILHLILTPVWPVVIIVALSFIAAGLFVALCCGEL